MSIQPIKHFPEAPRDEELAFDAALKRRPKRPERADMDHADDDERRPEQLESDANP